MRRISHGLSDCHSLEQRDEKIGKRSNTNDEGYCWEDWYCKDLRADPTASEAVVEVIIETLQKELDTVNGFLLGLLRAGHDTGYMAQQAWKKLRVRLTPLEAWSLVELQIKPTLVRCFTEAGFSLRGFNEVHPLMKKVIGTQRKYVHIADRKLSNGKHTARKEDSCISTIFLSEYPRASKSPAATSP